MGLVPRFEDKVDLSLYEHNRYGAIYTCVRALPVPNGIPKLGKCFDQTFLNENAIMNFTLQTTTITLFPLILIVHHLRDGVLLFLNAIGQLIKENTLQISYQKHSLCQMTFFTIILQGLIPCLALPQYKSIGAW